MEVPVSLVRFRQFVADFRQRHSMELEWVYVVKMLYGILDMVERGEFDEGMTIIAVITGPAVPSTHTS